MTFNIPYSFVPGTKAKAEEVNSNFVAVSNTLNSHVEKFETKLNKDLTNISSDGLNVIKNLTGNGKCLGEIITSNIPLTDAGLHLLDGALIQGDGIYSAFVDYIANLYGNGTNVPSYFCTETEWQDSVTQYGVCGKFVYDSVNNTVRLPKYSNKIYTQELDATAPVIGNGMALGLTNGTSSGGLGVSYRSQDHDTATNGYPSLYGSTVSTSSPTYGTGIAGALGVTDDPSKSGLIADLSDITTSLDGYYYIVIATSTKTDIQVDIDEIATDLNGKADTDLSNVPTSKGILTESYVNGTSWHRVYSDGWCEQGGIVSSVAGQGVTVTLLKPYTNTNYNITAVGDSNSEGTTYHTVIYYSKSPSNFGVTHASNGNYRSGEITWQTCGYIR